MIAAGILSAYATILVIKLGIAFCWWLLLFLCDDQTIDRRDIRTQLAERAWWDRPWDVARRQRVFLWSVGFVTLLIVAGEMPGPYDTLSVMAGLAWLIWVCARERRAHRVAPPGGYPDPWAIPLQFHPRMGTNLADFQPPIAPRRSHDRSTSPRVPR